MATAKWNSDVCWSHITDLQSFPCPAKSHCRSTAALPPRELLPRGPQGRDRPRQGDHFQPCAVATFSCSVTWVLCEKEKKMENSVSIIKVVLSWLSPQWTKQNSNCRYQETIKKHDYNEIHRMLTIYALACLSFSFVSLIFIANSILHNADGRDLRLPLSNLQ